MELKEGETMPLFLFFFFLLPFEAGPHCVDLAGFEPLEIPWD